jgi:hypothetical protein
VACQLVHDCICYIYIEQSKVRQQGDACSNNSSAAGRNFVRAVDSMLMVVLRAGASVCGEQGSKTLGACNTALKIDICSCICPWMLGCWLPTPTQQMLLEP